MGERKDQMVQLIIALLKRDPLNAGKPQVRLRNAAELALEATSMWEAGDPLAVLDAALRAWPTVAPRAAAPNRQPPLEPGAV